MHRAFLARAGEGTPREKRSAQRAGVVDSQSVKTTGVGGAEKRGYDGGKKKVKGRKRHLLVDTQGLVLKASRSTQRKGPGPGGHQGSSAGSRA